MSSPLNMYIYSTQNTLDFEEQWLLLYLIAVTQVSATFFRYGLFPRADVCMLYCTMYGFGPLVLFGIHIHLVFHLLYAVVDPSMAFL